ncbi:hypothetical protein F444_18147, partial [Phytophthora nicotianae P1976]
VFKSATIVNGSANCMNAHKIFILPIATRTLSGRKINYAPGVDISMLALGTKVLNRKSAI